MRTRRAFTEVTSLLCLPFVFAPLSFSVFPLTISSIEYVFLSLPLVTQDHLLSHSSGVKNMGCTPWLFFLPWGALSLQQENDHTILSLILYLENQTPVPLNSTEIINIWPKCLPISPSCMQSWAYAHQSQLSRGYSSPCSRKAFWVCKHFLSGCVDSGSWDTSCRSSGFIPRIWSQIFLTPSYLAIKVLGV